MKILHYEICRLDILVKLQSLLLMTLDLNVEVSCVFAVKPGDQLGRQHRYIQKLKYSLSSEKSSFGWNSWLKTQDELQLALV